MTPKIFVATPMYGGQCHGAYVNGLIHLQDVLRQFGVGHMTSFIYNESLITRARNALTTMFLRSDCTHLFFIDADIGFKALDVVPMILADVDVICGVYPKKEVNWWSVQKAVTDGVPLDQLQHKAGSFVVNLVDYAYEKEVAIDKPAEVWEAGCGFMLIKRSCLEQLKQHCATYVNDVPGNVGIAEEVVEFFTTTIDPQTRRLLSEDYDFCHRWREKCQGKVYVAPWVILEHFGTFAFTGQLTRHETPKAPTPSPTPALGPNPPHSPPQSPSRPFQGQPRPNKGDGGKPAWGSQQWAETYADDLGESPDY